MFLVKISQNFLRFFATCLSFGALSDYIILMKIVLTCVFQQAGQSKEGLEDVAAF